MRLVSITGYPGLSIVLMRTIDPQPERSVKPAARRLPSLMFSSGMYASSVGIQMVVGNQEENRACTPHVAVVFPD